MTIVRKKHYEALYRISVMARDRFGKGDAELSDKISKEVTHDLFRVAGEEYSNELWSLMPDDAILCRRMGAAYAGAKKILVNLLGERKHVGVC